MDFVPKSPAVSHGKEISSRYTCQGVNGFGHPRYDGPCPLEDDDSHRSHFDLLALDTEVALNPPKDPVAELWARRRPHVIAGAILIGACARRRQP